MKQTEKKLKILSIGNSYAEDAFEYVPFLMETIDPGTELTFGICHYPGCTLEQHCSFFLNNSSVYTFYKCRTGEKAWNHSFEKTLSFCMADEDWDIIILQQQSYNSQYYGTYQPYLNRLTEYIFGNTKKPVKLLWHLTQSYGQDPDGGYEMFMNTSAAAQRVLKETPIEGVIPIGTALQNARATRLGQIGDQKYLFSGNHCQEGLGCQTEGYTAVMYILKLLGKNYISVLGDRTITDKEWTKDKAIPGPDGEPIGSETENLLLAQKCAVAAIKNPFSVSKISE